jgi:hypothetical protein
MPWCISAGADASRAAAGVEIGYPAGTGFIGAR